MVLRDRPTRGSLPQAPSHLERLAWTAVVLVAAAWPLAAFGEPTTGTSIFKPMSSHASSIFHYTVFVLAITGAIFAAVATLLVIALVRFRRRPGDDEAEPPQVYGSEQIELAWTVIPILIVIVLSLTTARTVFQIQDRAEAGRRPRGHGHRPAVVVGVPLPAARDRHGQRAARSGERPASSGADLSDAAVGRRGPQLLGAAAGGQDRPDPGPGQLDVDRPARARAVPGPVRRVLRHAARQDAAARRTFDTRRGLRRWVAAQRAARRGPPRPSRPGGASSRRTACINCHTVRGTVGNGRYGPDLTHLMSRETIAAGAAAEHAGDTCARGSATPRRSSRAC